jgi:hypothetical protein
MLRRLFFKIFMNDNVVGIFLSWRNRVSLVNFYQDVLNKKCKIKIEKKHPYNKYKIIMRNDNKHLYHSYSIGPTGIMICQVSE